MDEKYETVKLTYTIHKFSSCCAYFIPENILVNKPEDQLSRWFTDNTTPPQYITLKLKSPAIVESIKFGKFIKTHVGNLKKFQVLGGTDENNLSVLLTAGLKNDSLAEVFRLRHRTREGLHLPVRYIKIVPLQSWGPAYNYTIWYVELMGKDQEELVNTALETLNMRKEEEAVRILLKHLRRRQYKDAFEALSRESGVQLEGPVQTKLFNALVENGDFKLAEQIFEKAVADGELEWYLSWQPHTPEWRLMSACSAWVQARLYSHVHSNRTHRTEDPATLDNEDSSVSLDDTATEAACGPAGCCGKPGPRGGHQLVVDSTTGTLYLYGGWNGTADLDDLWSYDTKEEKWSLLCRHSRLVGGPSPRSCHKMVFDPVHRKLYTLGRYLDNAQRVPANLNSDLYVYCVPSRSWSLVCADTARAGGPRLVFDHQMCIDVDSQIIYVFGGRVLPSNTEEGLQPQYSGLYAYYITTGTWELLFDETHPPSAPGSDDAPAPAPVPRVSHSMLFHPVQRRLYILAGQRNKSHLAELWWWEAESGRGHALCCAGPAPTAPPPPGFTQRATLDHNTDDIIVLSGMSKERDKRVYNTLWMFSLRRLVWTCVYRNDDVSDDDAAPRHPRPRFAHQLVYDVTTKIHYLFGGNPGLNNDSRLRLDDLWSLRLVRTDSHAVVAAARAALRRACYAALAAHSPPRALVYLRTELREALDVTQPGELAQFHKLPTALFAGGAGAAPCAGAPLSPRRTRALARRRAQAQHHTDIEQTLKVVLGAEDVIPECTVPFETITEPEVESWDVGRDEHSAPPAAWAEREARLKVYDQLCSYFRPSTVPPRQDLNDLFTL